ncbi:MAG TPA: hypothetical protein VIV57_02540 [Anaeromyxobacter sp.]
MSNTTIRFALAAALAALSVPAFAADASSVSGDPLFGPSDNLAPAITVYAKGGEAEALNADPTFPAIESAAPAIALVREAGAPSIETPAEWAPTAHYAIELGAKTTERVAKAR